MAAVVIDCSIALAWHLGDEVSKDVVAILETVFEGGALVPNLWHLELASGLQAAARQKRITQTDMDHILADLSQIPVEIDTLTARHAWTRGWVLSLKHGLTPYDAAYLDLAIRHKLPLATLDRALARAATKEQVMVLS